MIFCAFDAFIDLVTLSGAASKSGNSLSCSCCNHFWTRHFYYIYRMITILKNKGTFENVITLRGKDGNIEYGNINGQKR